jgi:hypothetical protein
MQKAIRVLVPLAVASIPLAFAPGVANAADNSYQTTLNPLNGSSGSGMATVSLNGDQAQVKVSWSGLPDKFGGGPYPHVQHIHIGGAGHCPTQSADKNADGVISTTEGGPAYGAIGTTLSTKGDTSPKSGTDIKIAPGGANTDYSRSIKLSSDTVSSLKNGTAVIVVHGLDPTTLSKKAQKEKSDLVPSLPLAATSPALCGVLSAMPTGGAATGTGSTSGLEDSALMGIGGGMLALGAGVAIYTVGRRRQTAQV